MARRKKVIIEEDGRDSGRQTIINDYGSGWAWLIAIILILAIWGIVGDQRVEDTGAECYFGIGDSLCWFWSGSQGGNEGFDINLNINNEGSNGDNGV